MHIDDIGIDRADRLIAQIKPLHPCHADIVDEDIGVGDQIEQQRPLGLHLHIQADGFFVAVERGVNRPEIAWLAMRPRAASCRRPPRCRHFRP